MYGVRSWGWTKSHGRQSWSERAGGTPFTDTPGRQAELVPQTEDNSARAKEADILRQSLCSRGTDPAMCSEKIVSISRKTALLGICLKPHTPKQDVTQTRKCRKESLRRCHPVSICLVLLHLAEEIHDTLEDYEKDTATLILHCQ